MSVSVQIVCSHMIPMGSKVMDIAGFKFGTVRKVIPNLPAIAL